MTCHMGGFPTIRHNDIRDITATLLTEVCHNVATEPPLIPLMGETFAARSADTDDNARLDIRARDFWNNYQDALFGVRVFYPNAPSNRSADAYKRHEQAKKREYGQRVREVEHGNFTPPVVSSNGRNGQRGNNILQTFSRYDRSKKKSPLLNGNEMVEVAGYPFLCLGALSYAFVGSRSSFHRPANSSDISLAATEGRVPLY